MESKYKINVNKPMPSDEEINQKKDFSRLMNTYEEVHKNPHKFMNNRHKKMKYIMAIVVIIAVALALYVSGS
ncbi:MAG: hypothetical protein GY827_00355 [Cytophagales bacterium]|nr:hypothetical protein [Cytophagales bacterium]